MKLNYQGHVIGAPGSGKTTLARELVRQHLEDGGWAFVHDPVRQYRDTCGVFPDVAAWRAAADQAVRDRRPMVRCASLGGSIAELLELVLELGERHGPGMRKLAVLDEGSLLETSGPSWIGRLDNQLLSMRRHLGIGLLFLQQRIAQLGRQFYEMCTEVYLFRLANPDGLESLEKYLNLAPATLVDVVPRLPDFGYVHAKNGVGLV